MSISAASPDYFLSARMKLHSDEELKSILSPMVIPQTPSSPKVGMPILCFYLTELDFDSKLGFADPHSISFIFCFFANEQSIQFLTPISPPIGQNIVVRKLATR